PARPRLGAARAARHRRGGRRGRRLPVLGAGELRRRRDRQRRRRRHPLHLTPPAPALRTAADRPLPAPPLYATDRSVTRSRAVPTGAPTCATPWSPSPCSPPPSPCPPPP